MELTELYEKLLAEGCNRFYIEGVGGPVSDDVECLCLSNGKWNVSYVERGQKSKPVFSTDDKNEAVNFYFNHIMQFEHRHLITLTRSIQTLNFYKALAEKHGIRTIQNDIPAYGRAGDVVYRLFVVNKDIFRLKEVTQAIPFFDEALKRRSE